jgi:D-alanine-D-alanine ligase
MQIHGYERSECVAVLLGGTSPEREISLRSGANVVAGLESLGLSAIDPATPNWLTTLTQANPAFVYNILHGGQGEDGTIVGLLETLGFAYSGSGVLGLALSMDKARCKYIWQSMGLPTLPFCTVSAMDDAMVERITQAFSAPYCLKTVDGGSSIGIEKVCSAADLPAAYSRLAQLGSDIICEPWLDGCREFTVGILHGEALPVIEIVSGVDFYDYAAKYQRNDTQYICPCALDDSQQRFMQDIAKQAFASIKGQQYGRVDCIQAADGTCYLMEINTVPGFTEKSLVPMAAKQVGYGFTDLLVALMPKTLAAAFIRAR